MTTVLGCIADDFTGATDIAGLLARGLPAPEAAGWGTLLHAKAARAFGPGLIGDDLPQTLPAVLREMGM